MSDSSYKEITHLGGLSHVRVRPGMYLGDYQSNEYSSGLMNLLREVLGNSVDEFVGGHATQIDVTYDATTNQMQVVDNGRGIPFGPTTYTDPVSKATVPIDKLHLATGVPNTGAKYAKGEGQDFKFAIGMNGIGIKAVNAVSMNFIASSTRDGQTATIQFTQGELTHPVTVASNDAASGTSIVYTPDPTLLPFSYQHSHVKRYLQETAYLNAGLKLKLTWIGSDGSTSEVTFHEPRGLEAMADKLAPAGDTLYSFPLIDGGEQGQIEYEVVLRVLNAQSEILHAYVNGGAIESASTPVVAVRQSYARALAKLWKDYDKPKKHEKLDLKTEDFRSGMMALIKVLHVDPAFDSQTKTKLINTDVAALINNTLPDRLADFLLANPEYLRKTFDLAIHSAELRLAAQKARDELNKKRSDAPREDFDISLGIYTPPLKNTPALNSLYMFEGESASGSLVKAAKQINAATGRPYKDHIGILALRGVPLNSIDKTIRQAMNNTEIATLIKVSGLNPTDPDDLSGLNFQHFIIAADEDAGGAHISSLLVTFFLFHFPEVIRQGRLKRVVTPLFELTDKKKTHFIYAAENKDEAVISLGYKPEDAGKRYSLRRIKGLGQLSDLAKMTLVREPRFVEYQTEDIGNMRALYEVFSLDKMVANRRQLIFSLGLKQST